MNNRKPFFIIFMQAATNFLFTIVELLLLGRIILLFFNASPVNGFVAWVYRWSDPLVAPFNGIFGSVRIFDTFTLDLDALLAWFVYLVIYVLIIEFIKFLNSLVLSNRI